MAIVAHVYPFVVGVDTHARNHVFAIITATGELVDRAQFSVTTSGMARALSWASRRTGQCTNILWVIEGIATYGAGLARAVNDGGYRVVEAARMNTKAHHAVGKTDELDAQRIATAVLALDETALRYPRTDQGPRAALRVLMTSRDAMTRERTSVINALTGLVRAFSLGLDARRPLTHTHIAQIAYWRTRTEDIALAEARREATRLARRVLDLDEQITANQARISHIIDQTPAAGLLAKTGIGPITAAVVYIAWSHSGRLHSEAAFAALAGVNPIPASSGNTVRYRLNRGGDRRLNRAIHIATITRMTYDPETRDYVEKRRSEGKTDREIRRILKRYLTRQIYRYLNTTKTLPNPA
jgi:transposase